MQVRERQGTAAVRGVEDYPLGHSVAEQRRLAEQGVILRPVTERFLRDAGLRRGMRVLDVGCGVGDVTCLAAEIVGSEGDVVGVDFSGAVLGPARSRAASRGIGWARFVEGDVNALSLAALDAEPFDAVVGRLVLMYQADPASVILRLVGLVRPGGLVAFLEAVALPPLSRPARPLYAQWLGRLIEAFERSGATTDMGLHLHQAFIEAGLPAPDIRLDGIVIGGPDPRGFRWLVEVIRSISPVMTRLGIADVEAEDIDTLADRLIEEAAAVPGAVCGLALGGACARTPAQKRLRFSERGRDSFIRGGK